VARPDVAHADQQDALFGGLFFQIVAELGLHLADCLVARRRRERQRGGREFRHQLVVEAQAAPGHLDLAGTQLVDLLESAAKSIAGEEIDLDRVFRQARHLRLEHLHRDGCRMARRKRAAGAPAHVLRRAS
jgi:hypothetical protein